MRLGGGVRRRQPPKPRYVGRKLEDTPIINVVDHCDADSRPPTLILSFSYICGEKAEIETFDSARQSLRRRETLMDDIARSNAGFASGSAARPAGQEARRTCWR
jgi:hypothetical protein